MKDEKQRLKRQEKRKVANKQAVLIKVKKHKVNVRNMMRIAVAQSSMELLGKFNTWLKLAFPESHEKKWKQFNKFLTPKV